MIISKVTIVFIVLQTDLRWMSQIRPVGILHRWQHTRSTVCFTSEYTYNSRPSGPNMDLNACTLHSADYHALYRTDFTISLPNVGCYNESYLCGVVFLSINIGNMRPDW